MTRETPFLTFWRQLNAALLSRGLPEAQNGLAHRHYETGHEPETAARHVAFRAAFG